MKKLAYIFLPLFISALCISCFDDLNTIPIDDDEVTSATVYDSPDSYKRVLAKVYAGLAISGQQGPAGQPDISGIDEGFSQYLRLYYEMQELTTDEAVIAWNDQTIQNFHAQSWDANDPFIAAIYSRIYYQISIANEFLRETTDEKLNSRGVSGSLAEEIKVYRAEARFLRALSYWHALDLFRNVPFVTEADNVGSFFPPQATPQEIFNFIESELLDIDDELLPPRSNEYARADQAAAWMLLAKLYLNAEVYLGTDRSADCLAQITKVVNAGYSLEPNYADLFLADNHLSDEIIFPIAFDGIATKTYGGMAFMIHAAVGGSMDPAEYGVNGGWAGTRTTSALVEKFLLEVPGDVVISPNPGNQTYPRVYVPGAYQGWDPTNEQTTLTSPNADGQFEGYIYIPAADQVEFKICTAPDWDNDYGDEGGDGTLDFKGANIQAPGPGLYHLRANFDALTYTLEPTSWGLIGDATPGGWDSDTDMTYNESLGALEVQLNLSAGEIKFRANDGWDLNYGDDGADGILEAGGSNIRINESGLYVIRLYLDHPDYTYSIEKIGSEGDSRAIFYTEGQSLEIEDMAQFTNGYAVGKFKNLTRSGAIGKDAEFPDTDFPLFRLADAYLMFAEAALRTGTQLDQALNYVNALQERAYGSSGLNLSPQDLTMDFIIDERARELYWECQRRTDLVRFNRFTTVAPDQVWPWKGGVKEGISVADYRDIFPIPSSDITANPTLTQNPNY